MTRMVAIVEPHRELALALSGVVELAHCQPLTMVDIDDLAELPSRPAVIVVRVGANLRDSTDPHDALERLAGEGTTTVVALAENDADVAEAERLGCDVVLRAPRQVHALYEALTNLPRL